MLILTSNDQILLKKGGYLKRGGEREEEGQLTNGIIIRMTFVSGKLTLLMDYHHSF